MPATAVLTPDHAARAVGEHAAAVAGIERRIGLDHLVDHPTRLRWAASGRAPTRCPRSRSRPVRAGCRAPRRAARRAAGSRRPVAPEPAPRPRAFSTARSLSGSRPTTSAMTSLPSEKAASARSAPSTTCALVSRNPSASMTLALPAPCPRGERTRRLATLGSTDSATPMTARE